MILNRGRGRIVTRARSRRTSLPAIIAISGFLLLQCGRADAQANIPVFGHPGHWLLPGLFLSYGDVTGRADSRVGEKLVQAYH